MSSNLIDLLQDVEHVMLDFDGPVCSVFGGDPAPGVARRLRTFAQSQVELPEPLRLTDDPLDFLELANGAADPFGRQIGAAVREAEVMAVKTATPTPGASDVLAAAKRSERALSIVSNNSTEAVAAYLADRGLIQYFEAVEARTGSGTGQMKPSPHLLTRALSGYASRHGGSAEQARRTSVFVGDSITDIRAAAAAGIVCIAYANKPGKQVRFEDSEAAAVITDMRELAEALNARWDAEWGKRGCC
jgi:phosphoglycolate phosphatase